MGIEKFLIEHEMVAHLGKSKIIKFGPRPALKKNAEDIEVLFNNQRLEEINAYKYLGIHMDSTLT